MAAMVQTIPSQAPTMTMMQSRSPSSDTYHTTPRNQQRNSHVPQNLYSPPSSGMITSNYRGHTTVSPIPPYAFTATPNVNTSPIANPLQQNPLPSQPRLENRTFSAPVIPQIQNTTSPPISARPPVLSLPFQYNSQGTTNPSNTSQNSKPLNQKSNTSIDLNPPALSATTNAPSKPSPDRYRRVQRRSETFGGPMNSNAAGAYSMTNGGGLYMNPAQASSSPTLSPYPAYRGQSTITPNNSQFPPIPARVSTMDDMSLPKSQHDVASRYRRRSISSLDAGDHSVQISATSPEAPVQTRSYAATLTGPAPTASTPYAQLETRVSHSYPRPSRGHERHGSAESSSSGRSPSRPASVKREVAAPVSTAIAASQQNQPITHNQVKLVNIPPRGSSDANKRLTNPSPLSKPVAMSPEPARKDELTFAAVVQGKITTSEDKTPDAPVSSFPDSLAAQQLAAVSKKDDKKQKSSRLRRAFSFGSAAELRKASAENNANHNTERAKLRKSQYATEEAQQDAIAKKQEAAGLGEGIYSGQGNFFTGSTDNLSISSTASSASVMIRKMGKGVKRGSRSLVGLFRPKSVVGVPPPDAAPEPSVAQVSMVTVEAEREKVNVNANASEQSGGGTGFPKLERNSLDAASAASAANDTLSVRSDNTSRRSIVGGEKERAEVLAAVKKGILKRAGTDSGNSSPVTRPVDAINGTRPLDTNIPPRPLDTTFSAVTDSPGSSAPSTPRDGQPPRPGHRRTDSVAIEGEDYFMSLARFASSDGKSAPGTPRSNAARNISFSPRIQFHDTYASDFYDRRGEIATCNRLTPMLAQQIKEELNSFKMEMEVHEASKVFTHFF